MFTRMMKSNFDSTMQSTNKLFSQISQFSELPKNSNYDQNISDFQNAICYDLQIQEEEQEGKFNNTQKEEDEETRINEKENKYQLPQSPFPPPQPYCNSPVYHKSQPCTLQKEEIIFYNFGYKNNENDNNEDNNNEIEHDDESDYELSVQGTQNLTKKTKKIIRKGRNLQKINKKKRLIRQVAFLIRVYLILDEQDINKINHFIKKNPSNLIWKLLTSDEEYQFLSSKQVFYLIEQLYLFQYEKAFTEKNERNSFQQNNRVHCSREMKEQITSIPYKTIHSYIQQFKQAFADKNYFYGKFIKDNVSGLRNKIKGNPFHNSLDINEILLIMESM